MKKYILILLLPFLLFSCFEDKGNYDYSLLKEPTWLIDRENTNLNVNCRVGNDAVFDGKQVFTWGEDSVAKKETIRYEWRVGDVVIGEGETLTIPTAELMKKLGMDRVPVKPLYGQFAIIEKETNVEYLVNVYLTISARYAAWDWLVLTEDGANSKLSVLLRKTKKENGATVEYFELDDNAFEKVNGEIIPGKPIDLALALARNISAEGSATIITDQVAYEVSNESLEKVGELKDYFLDGAPAGFQPIARREIDPQVTGISAVSFVASADGKVYTRTMSPNWLGGKFLSEPYYIDEKGYDIKFFGHSRFGNNFPCYDAKNSRVVIASVFYKEVGNGTTDASKVTTMSLIPMNKPKSSSYSFTPVWDMTGFDVHYISQTNATPSTASGKIPYTIFFTKKEDGTSWIGDFGTSPMTGEFMDGSLNMNVYNLGQGLFKEGTIFLTTANGRYGTRATKFHLFTDGEGKISYIERTGIDWPGMNTVGQGTLLTVDSKITFMTYDWYDCLSLWIGCENGDIYKYDISTMLNPILMYKGNVGGKVVALKQLGFRSMTTNLDYY